MTPILAVAGYRLSTLQRCPLVHWQGQSIGTDCLFSRREYTMYQRCTSSMLHPSTQCTQVRHDVGNGAADAPAQSQGIVSKWRQKERLKTTAVALVLCLNIGVDPPDVIKISPCARLECWVDPLSMQPPKALETIGANGT